MHTNLLPWHVRGAYDVRAAALCTYFVCTGVNLFIAVEATPDRPRRLVDSIGSPPDSMGSSSSGKYSENLRIYLMIFCPT